jgi:membrane-bound lytic murein transglycosylase
MFILYYSKTQNINELSQFIKKNNINFISYINIDDRVNINGSIYINLPNNTRMPLLPEIKMVPTLSIVDDTTKKSQNIVGEPNIIKYLQQQHYHQQQQQQEVEELTAYSKDNIYSVAYQNYNVNEDYTSVNEDYNPHNPDNSESMEMNSKSDEMAKRQKELQQQRDYDNKYLLKQVPQPDSIDFTKFKPGFR